MDITEMHLNIDLELNKLNSNLYEIILPQEKDYFLNRAQERFIKTRYSSLSNPKKQGFEMSQKRIDDLRNLLVPNYYDKCFQLPITDFDYTDKLKFYFPSDYLFLTSSRSKMTHNHCGLLPTVSNALSFKTVTFNFNNSNYGLLRMFLDGNILFPIGTLLGLGPEEKTLAVQTTVDLLNSTFLPSTWKAYASSYRGVTGDIVFVTTGTEVFSYSFGEDPTIINTITNTKSYLTATGNSEVSPNRFAQQDDIYIMQQDPFNKTDAFEGPLVIIHTDSIDVFYEPGEFIVNEIAISYLRKPKLMSSTTNQSCELSEETHAEIVRDAVNLLLETMEASGRLQGSLGVEQTNE